MTKISIVIATVLCLFIASCSLSSINSPAITITLGGKVLSVPLRYLNSNEQVVNVIRTAIPGLDSADREINLTIDASEVVRDVPGYVAEIGKYRDDLRLLVILLNEQEVERYTDSTRFLDIEKRENSYIDMIVESDQARNFVKVYRKIEYPRSWAVFDARAQDSILSLPSALHSNWIAHCLESGSPLTETRKLTLCKSFILVDQFAVHFTLTDINLQNIEAVRAFLSREVSNWHRKHANQQ